MNGARIRRGVLRRLGLVLVLALAGVSGLRAHPGFHTSAVAKVQRDGQFTVELTIDVLAFALNDLPDRIPDEPLNALLDGPRAELERLMQQAQRRFSKHFRVSVGGRDVPLARVVFPSVDDVLRVKAAGRTPRFPILLPCVASGALPADARTLSFSFPDVIGGLMLTVERPGQEPQDESLAAGATSGEFAVAVSPPASA